MPVRTFTVYPQSASITNASEPQSITYGIRATYPEPRLERRYGALDVCRGLTRAQVLQCFRKVQREDAVMLLCRDLSANDSVQIEMGSNELRLWNN